MGKGRAKGVLKNSRSRETRDGQQEKLQGLCEASGSHWRQGDVHKLCKAMSLLC